MKLNFFSCLRSAALELAEKYEAAANLCIDFDTACVLPFSPDGNGPRGTVRFGAMRPSGSTALVFFNYSTTKSGSVVVGVPYSNQSQSFDLKPLQQIWEERGLEQREALHPCQRPDLLDRVKTFHERF